MLWLIFARVLIMSAVMSVTGIFVMLVSRLIEKSVSKKQIYLLWVVPIMAAIIPVSGVFNSNITKSENSGVYTQSVFVGEPVTQGSETAAVPETDENTAEHAPRAVREDRAADKTAAAQSTVFERIAQIPPKTAAALIYLIGFVCCVLYRIAVSVRFRLKMRGILTEFECPNAEVCRERIGIGKIVKIYSAEFDGSPFVYGLIPRIVVPRGKIENEALMHEMAHIKYRDWLMMRLVGIMKTVHYFNPLAYVFANEIQRYMELSCDETVAYKMCQNERLAYSRSIVNCAAAANSGAMHLSGGGKNIKERIKTIMSPQDRRTGAKKANTAAFLNVLCFVLVAFRLDAAVPLNTYMANETAAIYSVRYYAGEDSWCSMAGRVKNSNATLVNSKMYRSFSADINTDLYNALNKKTLTAKIHVRMDRLLKELDGGDYSLNFCYYNSEPYIRADMIFLTVRVQGDKIIYTDCTDDIQENKNYSGEEGFRLMNNSISIRVGKIFED